MILGHDHARAREITPLSSSIFNAWASSSAGCAVIDVQLTQRDGQADAPGQRLDAFQHFQAAVDHLGGMGDKGARALPAVDQALGLEGAHRLAQGGPRDAHAAGQFRLGGQALARGRIGDQPGQVFVQTLRGCR